MAFVIAVVTIAAVPAVAVVPAFFLLWLTVRLFALRRMTGVARSSEWYRSSAGFVPARSSGDSLRYMSSTDGVEGILSRGELWAHSIPQDGTVYLMKGTRTLVVLPSGPRRYRVIRWRLKATRRKTLDEKRSPRS